jgi:hypothetical protein
MSNAFRHVPAHALANVNSSLVVRSNSSAG